MLLRNQLNNILIAILYYLCRGLLAEMSRIFHIF